MNKEELEMEKLKLEIAQLKKKDSFSSKITKGLAFGAGAVLVGNVLGSDKW